MRKGEYIRLDEDVLKMSSEDKDERRLQDVFFTTSLSRRMFAEIYALVFVSKFTVSLAYTSFATIGTAIIRCSRPVSRN